MPLIHMHVPQGVLAETIKRELYERVGSTVLEIEGGEDTPESRSITWMFINEIPAGGWAIGADPEAVNGKPKFLTVVSVPQGSLDEARKKLVVQRVNEVITDVIGGDVGPTNNWCMINEIGEGNWGAGGEIYRLADIARFLGVDPDSERGREVVTASA